MELEFKFENPSHDWAVLHVFKKYYDFFCESNKDIKIKYINSSNFEDRFQGGPNSAHILTIRNLENKKYIIVSYWDRVEDFFIKENGWDTDNCVEIISSSGVDSRFKIKPFSYLPYSTIFDSLSLSAKNFENKTKNELVFRGYLYGERLSLSKVGSINITNNKISPYEKYFEDLTNNEICLSLNGAGEICNRDFEILSAKSVLLRPKLKQNFHNDLIPYEHYIPFNLDSNPIIQSKIILDKYNEIKKNKTLLKTVSEKGYDWYQKNGTINSNLNILKKIINLNKLK